MNKQEILTAALADPDVLWAILTADVKVAGPWRRTVKASERVTADYMDNGYDCSHGSWAQVVPARQNKVNGWRFVVDGVKCAWFADRTEAEAACDAQLRAAGWLLATGEVERG